MKQTIWQPDKEVERSKKFQYIRSNRQFKPPDEKVEKPKGQQNFNMSHEIDHLALTPG